MLEASYSDPQVTLTLNLGRQTFNQEYNSTDKFLSKKYFLEQTLFNQFSSLTSLYTAC